MSAEKRAAEAARWLAQAAADLKAARGSRETGSHEWSCFQSQQAGEKALKAIWLFAGHDPVGHSLLRLVHDYPETGLVPELGSLADTARLLDKLYIPTRYPNGLPDLTPSEVYGAPDSEAAIAAAQRVIDLARQVLDPVGP
jgi:HEPN domain-containing protein